MDNQIVAVKSEMESQFQEVQTTLRKQQKTFKDALKTIVTKDDFEARLQEVLTKMEDQQTAFLGNAVLANPTTCVETINGVMNDTDCDKISFFICQAGNEV